jgi:hypothetical protein
VGGTLRPERDRRTYLVVQGRPLPGAPSGRGRERDKIVDGLLIVSSIRVPPTSLTPPRSIATDPSTPSFTHEHWMLSMRPCSNSRAMA